MNTNTTNDTSVSRMVASILMGARKYVSAGGNVIVTTRAIRSVCPNGVAAHLRKV